MDNRSYTGKIAEDQVIRAADSLTDAIAELKASSKFWECKPQPKPEPKRRPGLEVSAIMADEKHYTPDELAALWGVSAETIRTVFRKESGVLRLANPNEKKRTYVLMRIPESIAQRVHKRLSAVPQ
jgi:hypothetical protein